MLFKKLVELIAVDRRQHHKRTLSLVLCRCFFQSRPGKFCYSNVQIVDKSFQNQSLLAMRLAVSGSDDSVSGSDFRV
jgi:hypothetical protein